MQIQTTTITTENTQVLGTNFQITTFDQKTTAFCDCCRNSQSGTKEQLKNYGWGFSQGAEFCPNCND